MIAGSRMDIRRDYEDRSPSPVMRAWLLAGARAWDRAGLWLPLSLLYLLAVMALLSPWPFGAHPPWAYNWEGYTVWRWSTYWEAPTGPTLEIWAPSDGLMTDSGQGPLVGLPVALGIAAGGLTIEAMRVPVSLLAAAAVPLLWLLGRRVAGTGPATLAALLLATSPVFILYGRTATIVGVSLVPLLLMTLALVRVLQAAPDEGWRWSREGLLAAVLTLGIYAYAPVRLLWPLTVILLGLGALANPARRAVLLRAAGVCTLAVPLCLIVVEQLTAPAPDPIAAVADYFYARGEQLVAMRNDPEEARYYLREDDPTSRSGWETARQLVQQNAADLLNLLLDRGTRPVPLDYWNASGRLWPWFFVPFALIGVGASLWSGVRSRQQRFVVWVPLTIALGLALPLLFTSRVHVGRLLPALPLALLLVAAGAWTVVSGFDAVVRRSGATGLTRIVAGVLAGAILFSAASAAAAEMATTLAPTRERLTAEVLAGWQADALERGGAVLVESPTLGDEIERVHAATYRLDLDHLYRFVDLHDQPHAPASDSRPLLFWHGALPALEAAAIAEPCERLWFIAPEINDEFMDAWHSAGCSGVPDSVVLP